MRIETKMPCAFHNARIKDSKKERAVRSPQALSVEQFKVMLRTDILRHTPNRGRHEPYQMQNL